METKPTNPMAFPVDGKAVALKVESGPLKVMFPLLLM